MVYPKMAHVYTYMYFEYTINAFERSFSFISNCIIVIFKIYPYKTHIHALNEISYHLASLIYLVMIAL